MKPKMSPTLLRMRREAIKFSAAHMTVFEDGTKERLHGHNYQTSLTASVKPGALVEFRHFKEPLKRLCEAWDERVFLAAKCQQFRILKSTSESLEFRLCGVRYVLPMEEVIMLPVENITSESLAETLLALLYQALPKTTQKLLLSLELTVEESPGQGATARFHFPSTRRTL
jgi:6-pyruvoyltetrahydropterin/6-carboxytetrahydropterin synthase